MLIGRRLVKDWGNGHQVVLEKLKPVEPLTEGLYEVFQLEGETFYLRIGQPQNPCTGRTVSEIFETPGAWMTSNEVAQLAQDEV